MSAPIAPDVLRPDPAAPAAPTQSPAPAPPLGPQPTPIQKAVADARAAIAASQAAPAPAAAPAAPATPPAGEEEQPPESQEAQAVEGEEEQPPDGQEAEGQEGEEEEPPKTVLIDLPVRRVGEVPIQIEVADEEVAERLRQMSNSEMRRETYRKEMSALESQRQELDLVEQHIRVDPVGFIVERVAPDAQVGLAMHLLSIPSVYDAVSRELEEWVDPNIQARRQAELARDREVGRRNAESQMAVMNQVREQSRIVKTTVDSLVPADMKDDEAQMFRDDCLSDVAEYARANPSVTRLRPEEVLGIVERRLRLYGVDPQQAQAVLSSGQSFRRAPAARSPKQGAPASSGPDAEAASTAGAKLVQASAVRRAAAAVPAGGAGARPTRYEPKPQQTVKERIADLRKNILGR